MTAGGASHRWDRLEFFSSFHSGPYGYGEIQFARDGILLAFTSAEFMSCRDVAGGDGVDFYFRRPLDRKVCHLASLRAV